MNSPFCHNKRALVKNLILFLAFTLVSMGNTNAQARYWMGGAATGDLTDGTKWSATLGGAAIGGTLVVTNGQYYYVDGTDLNGATAGAGVGPVTINCASTRNPGQLIIQNGNVVVNITATSANNLNVGSTSAASNTGDDLFVGTGCTLNVNASSHLYLNSTSNATTHSANFAGTVNLLASAQLQIKQSANTALTSHKISGTMNINTSSSLVDFTATTLGATFVDISGTINLNNGTTAAGRLNFTGTSTSSRITVTGTINIGGNISNLGQLTWGGSGTYSSPAGAFIVNSPGVLNYTATTGQSVLNNLTINSGATVVYGGSSAKTTAIGHLYTGGKLSIQGTATTSGIAPSFTTSTSTLEYKGTSAQTMSTNEWTSSVASSPWNVIIDNASGVAMPFSRTIQGTLTLTTGVLNLNGAYTLTFTAPATQQPIVRTSGTLTMASTAALTFAPASGVGTWTIPDATFTSAPTFSLITSNMIAGNTLALNNQAIILSSGYTLTSGLVALGTGDLQVAAITISSPSATKMFVTSATSGLLKHSFSTSSFQSFDYPIGEIVGTAEYNGFTFSLASNSTTRVIGFKVVDGIHTNMNTPTTPTNYLTRFYTSSIAPSTGTYTYSADLPYNGTTGDIIGTEASIGVVTWNGSAWVGLGAEINTTGDDFSFSSANQTNAPLGGDIVGRKVENDEPCGAIILTPGAAGAGCTNVVTGNISGSSQTFSGGTCGTADDDVWYKFTATATSHVVRVSPSASFDASLQAYYNAACGSIVSGSNISTCQNGTAGTTQEIQLSSLTIGFVYYVRVWDYAATPPATATFDICVMTPPANDNVCGAVNLTPYAPGITTNLTPVSGDVTLASQTFSGCIGNANDDIWYKFTATATAHTVRVTPSASFDAVVQAYYNAACASVVSGSSIGTCENGTAGTVQNLFLSNLTVGNTYFVRVYDYGSGTPTTTSFTIAVFTPNINDEYCNGSTVTATTLTPGSSCVTTNGDAVWASQTNGYGSCDYSYTSPLADMWYRFQATNTSHQITVTGNGTYDPIVTAYSAGSTSTCPVTPSAISGACIDYTTAGGTENLALTGLTVNNWYYVRVYHGSSTVPTNTTFTICILNPPANDEPCNAITVTPNAAGSTSCGTPISGNAGLASQTNGYSSCDYNNTSPARDVWFKFVATAKAHTIQVTGSTSYDPIVTAYTLSSGTCPTATFTLIASACVDATGNAGLESLKLTNLTVGTTYYYRVYHGSSIIPATTTFSTCIFTPNTNDEFCNGSTVTATTLTPGSSCATINGDAVWASQTNSYGSCDYGYTSSLADMWYRFQATTTSLSISVTGNGTFDPIVTAYSAGSTSTCPVTPSAISGACIDNTGAGATENLSLTGLTVNNWYYVRVYHGSSTVPTNTTFTICAVLPPANDECAGAINLTLGAAAIAGTTVGGTNSGTSSYCGSNSDDVWYSFTAPAGGAVKITVVGTGGFDPAFNLRGPATCPAAGSNLVCVDYAGNNGTDFLRITGLTPSSIYKIRVMRGGASSGTFTIAVDATYIPGGNDNVASATTAAVGNTSGNSSASYGMQLGEPVGNDWYFSGLVNDPLSSQWFTFTPITTACYTVAATHATPTTSFDSELTIYTVSDINNFATYTELSSAEDIGVNSFGYHTLNGGVAVTLTAGITYYIQVGMYPYLSGTPTLRIVDRTASVPVANAATNPGCTGFTANWTAATNAVSYELDVATDADFTDVVLSSSLGNVTSSAVSGLTASTHFYYRLRAVSLCGIPSANSNVITIDNTLVQPGAFTVSTASLCAPQTGVIYTVPNNASVSYSWSYSGTGITINGTGNSVTLDFAANATSGTLSVTASLGCGTSLARSIAITINPMAIPASVEAATGATLTTGDLLWSGNSTTVWGTISNWYAYDGTDFAVSTAIPTSASRVFILPSSTPGICVSAINNTIVTASGNAKDVFIGNGATVTINAGQNLSVNGNWVNNGIFTPDATAKVIFDGTSAQSIEGDNPTNFTNLEVNKSAGTLILNKPVTVSGNLIMTSGDMQTSATNLLTVGTSIADLGAIPFIGSTVWTGGTIIGPLKRYFSGTASLTAESGIFPVGLSGLNRFAQVNYTSGLTTGGTITAEYVSGTGPVGSAGLPTTVNGQMIQYYENEGYWSIEPNGGDLNSATYSLILHGKNLSTSTSSGTMSTLRIIKSVSHTTWDNTGIGTHTAPVGGYTDFTIANTDMTGFSFFNIGSDDATPLPVNLVSFSAACASGDVNLNWTTASEQNSLEFDLERSRDLNVWEVIKTITAAGNSSQNIDYSHTDPNVPSGISYYRLIQRDQNGKTKIFSPISSSCSEISNRMIVFPNPSAGDFTVEIDSDGNLENSSLQIADLTGKVISTRGLNISPGKNQVLFSGMDLQKGTYIISLTNSEDVFKPVKVIID